MDWHLSEVLYQLRWGINHRAWGSRRSEVFWLNTLRRLRERMLRRFPYFLFLYIYLRPIQPEGIKARFLLDWREFFYLFAPGTGLKRNFHYLHHYHVSWWLPLVVRLCTGWEFLFVLLSPSYSYIYHINELSTWNCVHWWKLSMTHCIALHTWFPLTFATARVLNTSTENFLNHANPTSRLVGNIPKLCDR